MSSPGKYRALRVDNREMVYGSYTHVHDEKGNPSIIPTGDNRFVSVIPETVGQYTGKKDYNGRDIYADDILKSCTTKRVLTVAWSDSKCAFMLWGDTHENFMADWDLQNFEVTGNIHQHPQEGK